MAFIAILVLSICNFQNSGQDQEMLYASDCFRNDDNKRREVLTRRGHNRHGAATPKFKCRILAPDDTGLRNNADLMEEDIAVPALAVLQQHGADEAQAMIQAAFDERARELEADMLDKSRQDSM